MSNPNHYCPYCGAGPYCFEARRMFFTEGTDAGMIVTEKLEAGMITRVAGVPSLCIECMAIMVFADEEGNLREATTEELDALKANAPLWEAMKLTRAALRHAHLAIKATQGCN